LFREKSAFAGAADGVPDHVRRGRQIPVKRCADHVFDGPPGHSGVDPQPLPQPGIQPRRKLDLHEPS
jgi:hypothetical protein